MDESKLRNHHSSNRRMPNLTASQFSFLGEHHQLLVVYATKAELYAHDDPNTSHFKLRQFAETMAEIVLQDECHISRNGKDFLAMIGLLERRLGVEPGIISGFDLLRRHGNDAVHNHEGKTSQVLEDLQVAFRLSKWFHYRFSRSSTCSVPHTYVTPGPPASGHIIESKAEAARLDALELDLENHRTKVQELERLAKEREGQFERDLRGKDSQTKEVEKALKDRDEQIRQLEAKQVALEAQHGASQLAHHLVETENNRKLLNRMRQERNHFFKELTALQEQAARDKDSLTSEVERLHADLAKSEEANARREKESQDRILEQERKQREIELEHEQLLREQDELLAEKARLANDNALLHDVLQSRVVDEDLAEKARQIEANQSQLLANRAKLIRFRDELIVFHEKVKDERAQNKSNLATAKSKLAQLERSNRELKVQVEELSRDKRQQEAALRAKDEQLKREKVSNNVLRQQARANATGSPERGARRQGYSPAVVTASITALGLLAVGFLISELVVSRVKNLSRQGPNGASLDRQAPVETTGPKISQDGLRRNRDRNEIAKQTGVDVEAEQDEQKARTQPGSTKQKPVLIQPSSASQWEGKIVTVRLVVKSTRWLWASGAKSDRPPFALVINSELEYQDPKNFSVLVYQESAGVKYKEKGVGDLSQYFRLNDLLHVTGEVERYSDKTTGKVKFEIKVRDPDQIQRK